MRKLIAAGLVLAALTGCAFLKAETGTTTNGQLFCALSTGNGAALTVALVSAVSPGVVVMAMDATKDFVDAACAAAHGVPVSPPANPVAAPKVAIVPPAA